MAACVIRAGDVMPHSIDPRDLERREEDEGITPTSTPKATSRTISKRTQAPRPPPSQLSQFGAKVIQWLQTSGKGHSFYNHIPSRVGQSPCIDLALTATIEAHGIDNGDPTLSQDHCFHTSTLATGALRSLMKTARGSTSDEAMLTVALIFFFEHSIRAWTVSRTRAPVDQTNVLHMRGLAAMFISRPPDAHTTDLYKALWYSTNFYLAFILQLLNADGSSPFERPMWLELDPPLEPDATSDSTVRLRKISNKLYICLPRLIRLWQAARGSNDVDLQQAALKVSELLYALKDDAAEDSLLHHVNVVKSQDTSDDNLVRWIFKFSNFTEFDAAVSYWTARLLVLLICHRICKSIPSASPESRIYLSQLQTEGSRTAKNIMMSWESILHHKQIFTLKGSVAHQAVWGVLKDFDVCKGKETSVVKNWILEKANEISRKTCLLTSSMMDGFVALMTGEGIWMPQMEALRVGSP